MKTENPQAFPDPMRGAEQSYHNQSPDNMDSGMTLRDYFAAKAVSGFTSATNTEGDWTTVGCAIDIAEFSYEIADAMLKERLKQKP